MMLPPTNLPISQTLVDAGAMSLEHRLKSHETKEELMKTAKQFEGVFLQQMFTAMDKTVDRTDGMLDGGSAEETFRGMFYERVAASIADRPGSSAQFGIAAAIYKQLEAQLPKDSGAPSDASATKGAAHD